MKDKRRRQARHLLRLVVGLLVLAPVVGSVDGSVAAEHGALDLRHTPPSEAVAGDPLDLEVDLLRACGAQPVCPAVQLTATYGTGEGSRKVAVEVSPGGDVTAVVTIPGDAVRFPGLSYRLDAAPVTDADVTAAQPTTDIFSYEVPVALAYRVGFRYPDGLPATGATVIARSSGSGPLWMGTTDARGFANIALAQSDVSAARMPAGADYSQLFITAFDAMPDDSVAESRGIDGNGVDIVTFANLGNTLLDAVDAEVQDRIFTLEPQTRDFSVPMSTASSTPPGCQPFPNGEGYVCNEMIERIYNVGVPLANNVGGGYEMSSSFSYNDSTFTSTSVLVKVSNSWAEAQGETTSEKRSSFNTSSGNIGPGGNRTVWAAHDFVRERETVCHRGSCSTSQRVRPEKWNGGFYGTATSGYHDLAAQMQNSNYSDCVIKIFAEATSETSKGQKLSFSIAVEGQARGLKARTRYVNERGSSVRSVHRWRTTGAARTYHHLFVKYGLVDPNGPAEKNKCPTSHPEETWTDSSNFDKSAYGPPSRHTVNGVHHGLFRSVNNVGADRIHTWHTHDHGGLSAGLWTCAISSPCDGGLHVGASPDALFHCGASDHWDALVTHVHCEGWTDDLSAMGFYTPLPQPDGGMTGCGTAAPEGPANPYPDGHGITCHDMYDELSNGPGAE